VGSGGAIVTVLAADEVEAVISNFGGALLITRVGGVV